MKKTEIIETLKAHYDRDTRKQLVKSILQNEKQEEETAYKIINQIFSYVLKELNWNMSVNAEAWDNTPLEVMEEVFPKIESTKWYQDQHITTTKEINVLREDEKK